MCCLLQVRSVVMQVVGLITLYPCVLCCSSENAKEGLSLYSCGEFKLITSHFSSLLWLMAICM